MLPLMPCVEVKGTFSTSSSSVWYPPCAPPKSWGSDTVLSYGRGWGSWKERCWRSPKGSLSVSLREDWEAREGSGGRLSWAIARECEKETVDREDVKTGEGPGLSRLLVVVEEREKLVCRGGGVGVREAEAGDRRTGPSAASI